MIYSNNDLKVHNETLRSGATIKTLKIDPDSDFIPTSIKDPYLTKGNHYNMSFGTTKSGKPRIDYKKDNKSYVILSPDSSSSRDFTVEIYPLDKDSIKRIFLGNYSHSFVAEIDSSKDVLMRVKDSSVENKDYNYIFAHKENIYYADCSAHYLR